MNKAIKWTPEKREKVINEHIRLFAGQSPNHKTMLESQKVLPLDDRRQYFTTMRREPVAIEINKRQGLDFPPQRRSPRPRPEWECPYCDYSTNAKGGKTRHLKKDHPRETGLIDLRNGASLNRQTLEDRVVERVAELIYRDLKGSGQ